MIQRLWSLASLLESRPDRNPRFGLVYSMTNQVHSCPVGERKVYKQGQITVMVLTTL